MSDDMKHIILANMNVKLYSWPTTFRKVVRQQIWGEVVVFNSVFFRRPFLNLTVKNYESWSTLVEVIRIE